MTLTKKSLLTLALIASFSLASCGFLPKANDKVSHFDQESIKDASEIIKGNHYIAVAAPLTGAYRELGKTILEGAELAVEEFNEKASADKRVGILTIDDGGLVGEAIERADLVVAQNCLGVIGHLNSEVSIEASKRYISANIPQISPASSHPKFTERPSAKGFVFRTIGTDRQLGESAADYVLKNPDFKKIAVLFNDRPYGVSVSSEFVRQLSKDSSKEIVFYETIPVRTSDHSETVKKVSAKAPDLVYFVGEYNDAGYLLKQLKSKLPSVQFLAAEGVHNQEFINIAGSSSEGSIIVGMKTLSGSISTKYKERYQKDDAAFVGASYDATKILLSAIKDNNFKDTAAIAKSISDNPIFDANGDMIKPNFVLYRVDGSKFVQL